MGYRSGAYTLTRLILEKLVEGGELILDSFFPAKYPEARLWRTLLGVGSRYRFKRETFSSLLSRLQSQGLIARSGARRKSTWRLTKRGAAHVASLMPQEGTRPDGIRRLVVFDIPERDRKKRRAIRSELVVAGFVPLQKSVWYGERPLPPEFLGLVDALHLERCVHVFSVRREGTLRSFPPKLLSKQFVDDRTKFV